MITALHRLLILSGVCLAVGCAFGFTKVGNVYTLSGADATLQADLEAAIADAAPVGDQINLPAGTHTFGASANTITVSKAIKIVGAGPDLTTIQLAVGASTGNTGTFILTGGLGLEISGLNIAPPTSGTATATVFTMQTNSFWRITNCRFPGNVRQGYIFRVLETAPYGLIDNCYITGGDGSNEFLFHEGPSNSWQTDSTMGGPNNLFFEDNRVDGLGYTDANNNARAVMRFNTVEANNKFDGHGRASNSKRGVRHMEIYENEWTTIGFTSSTSMEIRGGTGMIWNNRARLPGAATWPNIMLRDYYASGAWSTNGYLYLSAADYPIEDQIGVGKDPRVAASEPMYLWYNRRGTASTPNDWPLNQTHGGTVLSATTDTAGYSAGATSVTLATGWTATIRPGNWIAYAVSGTTYFVQIAAQKSTGPGAVTLAAPGLPMAIPGGQAVTMKVGNLPNYWHAINDTTGTATYTSATFIRPDVDYFKHTYGGTFTGASGGGRGTKAEMLAIVPPTLGVFFWVMDEGGWNRTFTGTKVATAIAAGDYCEITSLGTTDFRTIGAVTNVVGEVFKATGTATGTGTVQPAQGRLYTWTLFGWQLKYEPYIYPHPQRNTGPDVTPPVATAAIALSGLELVITLSEPCTAGAGGTGGITISASGGPITATYTTGNGTTVWRYALNRTVPGPEVVTWSYSIVNGIEDAAGNDLAPVSNGTVTNGSGASSVDADPNPWRAAVAPGIF